MNPLDMYSRMLEKRAADEADSQEDATSELRSNLSDQRDELGNLFSHTSDTEKKDTKLVQKSFPQAKKDPETTTSNALLKVAENRAFFEGLRETGLLKTANPLFLRTAYQGFQDELNKIAGTWVLKSSPGKAMAAATKITSRFRQKIPASTIKPTGNVVR